MGCYIIKAAAVSDVRSMVYDIVIAMGYREICKEDRDFFINDTSEFIKIYPNESIAILSARSVAEGHATYFADANILSKNKDTVTAALLGMRQPFDRLFVEVVK